MRYQSTVLFVLFGWGIVYQASAEDLAKQIEARFVSDAKTHVFQIKGPQDWDSAADVALEISAKTLFIRKTGTRLSDADREFLLGQILSQTSEVVSYEAAARKMQEYRYEDKGAACLKARNSRGWGPIAYDGEEQAGIPVPRCAVNAYDTGTVLRALYDASGLLAEQASTIGNTIKAQRYRKISREYFSLAEKVFDYWQHQLWSDSTGFYEKFMSDAVLPDGSRPTQQVFVPNTNALMGLAHLAAVQVAEILGRGVPQNHIQKASRIAATIENEFNSEAKKGHPVLIQGATLPWPKNWNYSRNVVQNQAGTPEDSNHASYTLEFLLRLAPGSKDRKKVQTDGFPTLDQLHALSTIFMNNVAIFRNGGFQPAVCARRETKDKDSTRDWRFVSPTSDTSCPEGFTLISTFYQHVNGDGVISYIGRPRRTGYGWLDLAAYQPEILPIFTRLFSLNYLPSGEKIPSSKPYSGNTLYLLAKLFSAVTN